MTAPRCHIRLPPSFLPAVLRTFSFITSTSRPADRPARVRRLENVVQEHWAGRSQRAGRGQQALAALLDRPAGALRSPWVLVPCWSQPRDAAGRASHPPLLLLPYSLLALVLSTPISPGFLQLLCPLDPSYRFCSDGEHLTVLCMAKTMRTLDRKSLPSAAFLSPLGSDNSPGIATAAPTAPVSRRAAVMEPVSRRQHRRP
ncbi:uncharacterized protein [Patagioenas fasciata]|uniref:uncharacterized protein n=1 Tax=Patagioenas fasciata TaxID=372321 RepID=UPI003A9A193E